MVFHVFPVSLKKIACVGGLAGQANCSRHEFVGDPCVIAGGAGATGVRSSAGSVPGRVSDSIAPAKRFVCAGSDPEAAGGACLRRRGTE
ncbi:hypothetical protein ebA2968 [Aromatoleum aromaticum EbN1]|uniref:Uncharacterized protein n=1 Tax=Aromatoleum aromaticum (strain DSM 19018 / LMG 30748 / EbN1) TaxID=76114 RepID=Q5P4G8_AROAE|nr:hypothetical protein ebA2968 [Aromatoleum aromaticum EbN1]